MKRWSFMLRKVALLLLFWMAVVHFAVVLPPFEGSDEDKHYGYVMHLRETGRFPDPRDSLQLPSRQASGQAPFYYLLSWLWSSFAPDYQWDGSIVLNPYVNPVRPVLYWPDNANVFMYGPDQLASADNPALVQSLMWQRWLSPLMGMVAVSLAYGAARLILSRRWALFAMLLFAFNPVLIYNFACVTNDGAAILAGTAITYCLVTLVQRPITVRLLIISGIVTAIGVLTKANALVFVPLVFGVALFRVRKWRAVFKTAALLSLPILLIGAPWYLWNAAQYSDPFGIQPHLRTFWALPRQRTLGEAILWTLQDNAYQIRTLWYGIASGVVMSSHTVLIAPLVLVVFAGVGYLRAGRDFYRQYRLVLLMISAVIGAMLVAYILWLTRFDAVTGRLLLPGYLALVLGLTLGLAHGWRSLSRVRVILGTGIVFGAVFISGYITLPRFYTVSTLSLEAVPALNGDSSRFGDVQLIGYKIEPEQLQPGVTPSVTLCWRSLREDAHLPVPYAFAFHITDNENRVYYGRDSYPGMGLYTNWQPGRAFCDRFTLEMRESVSSGRAYRVAIALFDPNTMERVPEDDGKVFIGWVAAPGAVLSESEPVAYDFEGVYLLNYSMKQQGNSLIVQAEWGTGNWQPHPLSVFIHVLDTQNQPVTQLDVPLGGDVYPSMLWGNGERTHSEIYQVMLPDDLSGEYTVLFGLYDAERRLSVVDAEGIAQANGVVRLGVVQR